MERIVGIGEYVLTNQKADVIKTFALASCVAVTVYSPKKLAAGMIHMALPEPMNRDDSVIRPWYFATTGLPIFLNNMCKLYGCNKEELVIGVFGGASSIRNDDLFKIGERNITVVKTILGQLHLKINKFEVGGTMSRTLKMSVDTGDVIVSTQPMVY